MKCNYFLAWCLWCLRTPWTWAAHGPPRGGGVHVGGGSHVCHVCFSADGDGAQKGLAGSF